MPLAPLAEWPGSFLVQLRQHGSGMGIEIESAQKVDPGEEHCPAAPAEGGTRTRDPSIKCPSFRLPLSYPRNKYYFSLKLERERERDRQTDRQTDRDRQTETETDRQTGTDRDRDRLTDRQKGRQAEGQADRQRHTKSDRQTDRQTETETETESMRERENPLQREPFPRTLWKWNELGRPH